MHHPFALVHRIRRRALILVLSLTLVATLMPTAAFAAPVHDTGRMQPRHQPDRRPDHRPDRDMRCETTYRVRKGDNLTRISRHFGVSIQALIRANNIRNPNRIFAGQVLCIP